METRLWPNDDPDDRTLFNDRLLEQATNHLYNASVYEMVNGLLRVGTLALAAAIVTGVFEVGLGIAVAGTAWLYYSTSPTRLPGSDA